MNCFRNSAIARRRASISAVRMRPISVAASLSKRLGTTRLLRFMDGSEGWRGTRGSATMRDQGDAMRRAVVLAVVMATSMNAKADDPCAAQRASEASAMSAGNMDEIGRTASDRIRCEDAVRRAEGTTQHEATLRKIAENKAERERERIAAKTERIESNRKAAEEAAKQQAAADAADQAEVERIDKNKKLMSAIFGAGFCLLREARQAALMEIATQKKYARLGGAQNLSVLYGLQGRIRLIDEREAKDRVDMKGRKGVIASPCSSKEVKALLFCKRDASEECAPLERAVQMITDPEDLGGEDE